MVNQIKNTNPIENSDTNKSQPSSITDTIVQYAGRVWKWITVSIPNFFTHDIPAFFSSFTKKNSPDLKGKQIQPLNSDNLKGAAPISDLAKDRFPAPQNNNKALPQEEPDLGLANLFAEPEIRGPNKPPQQRGARAENAAAAQAAVIPAVPKVFTPLAGKLINPINHQSFTEIRVMNQRNQREDQPFPVLPRNNRYIPIGDEACGYQSFKNALVGIAVGFDAKIPSNTFEDMSVYDYLYSFMKKYRQSDVSGDRDITFAEMPKIFADFAKLKSTEFDKIPDGVLRQKIKAIHEAVAAHPTSISIFNLSLEHGKHFFAEFATLTSLENLKAFTQHPGPITHTVTIGTGEHWTTILIEKDPTGKIKWYGCDSWPGHTPEELITNIGVLEEALANIDTDLEIGYRDAVGSNFNRVIADYFDARGLPKQDLASQTNLQNWLTSGGDYPNQVVKAFEFVQKSGWLTKTADPQISQHLKSLKVLANYMALSPLVEDQYKIKLAAAAEALNALNLR